jgi:hypothetical protein
MLDMTRYCLSIVSVLLGFLLGACAAGETAQVAPLATVVSTRLPQQPDTTGTPVPSPIPLTRALAEPTVTILPAATAEPATQIPLPLPSPTGPLPVVTSGITAEGVFFRGDSLAPLTIIDYSDFL